MLYYLIRDIGFGLNSFDIQRYKLWYFVEICKPFVYTQINLASDPFLQLQEEFCRRCFNKNTIQNATSISFLLKSWASMTEWQFLFVTVVTWFLYTSRQFSFHLWKLQAKIATEANIWWFYKGQPVEINVKII